MPSLSKLFTPPKLEFDDFFEEAKYVLSYRVSLFLSIALFLLTINLSLFFHYYFIILGSSAFTVSFISFLLIRRTGKYKTFITVFNILGFFICESSLYLIKEQPHISDMLWMIVNIMMVFMTTGRKAALIIAFLHTASLVFFHGFYYDDQIHLIRELTDSQLIGLTFNIATVFSMIIYLSWQSIITTTIARDQLNGANQILRDQLDTINRQNDEKTTMLKEIHHRVKNNLQVITSLLRLQSRELTHPEAIEKFRETTNRVIAMSIIHEKMYQSEELSNINLKEYFQTLSNDLISSYQVGFPIEIDFESNVSSIGLKPIVPLALILNELLSNSLKHAFNKEKPAEIKVIFNRIDPLHVELIYTDSGSWKKQTDASSFGLDLIDTLTEQLDGTKDLSFNPTQYSFKFKIAILSK